MRKRFSILLLLIVLAGFGYGLKVLFQARFEAGRRRGERLDRVARALERGIERRRVRAPRGCVLDSPLSARNGVHVPRA